MTMARTKTIARTTMAVVAAFLTNIQPSTT
jgi:hypothetical protein